MPAMLFAGALYRGHGPLLRNAQVTSPGCNPGRANANQRSSTTILPGVSPRACQFGRYIDSTCGGGTR